MRSEHEIKQAETEHYERVWLERHRLLRDRYDDETQKKADEAAARIEERVSDTGPYDDFEWGKVSGELSALRWVLGDEWDNLES